MSQQSEHSTWTDEERNEMHVLLDALMKLTDEPFLRLWLYTDGSAGCEVGEMTAPLDHSFYSNEENTRLAAIHAAREALEEKKP